jgi:uncharacterized protein
LILKAKRNNPFAMDSFLRSLAGGVDLAVKLQPRASKNQIDGPLGRELKIKVTAPPVEAAANQVLVDLLAEKLGCARGSVKIMRGHTSRHKTGRIPGLDAETILRRLQADENFSSFIILPSSLP